MRLRYGFTYIELLLVISLIIILGTLTTAYYSRFYAQNSARAAGDVIAATLRKAQTYSMTGKQNSTWGVYYSGSQLTLFQGTSYASRTTASDEVTQLNGAVGISGLSEVTFARGSGVPNAPVTISISANGQSRTVTVNTQGGIER